MKYRGVVLNIEGKPTLIVKKEDGTLTDGMVTSDIDCIYEAMGEKRISCVFVQFKDGTVPKKIEEFWDEEDWAENIFFTIVDLKFVAIVDSKKRELTISEIIDGKNLYNVVHELLNDNELYDIDAETITVFDEVTGEKKKTTIAELVKAVKEAAEKRKKK